MGDVKHVGELVDGPPSTFERFYARERLPMVRVAYLITRSHPLAEEVVQDAFVAVLERWEAVDSPGGYLRQTVVRAAVAIRNRSRRGRALERAAHDSRPSEPGIDEMRAALGGLPPRQRAALVLRFYCDLPHEDIAAVLSCTVATARSLTHRGLTTLRRDMDRWTTP